MKHQGWIKVYRKLVESYVWTDARKLKLWLLVLTKASHSGNEFPFNGQSFIVEAGQFVTGRESLAREYNYKAPPKQVITERTLWRWIKEFESNQMLSIKSTTKYSYVSVTNWAKYQNDDQQMTNKSPTDDQQMSTIKNAENAKNNTSSPSKLEDDFSELWELYPRKEGKKPAYAAYKRAVTRSKDPATNKQIQDGIVAYKQQLATNGTDKKYIKQGSTFFNQESWNDYVAIADKQEKHVPQFDKDEWLDTSFRNGYKKEEILRTIKENEVPIALDYAANKIDEFNRDLAIKMARINAGDPQ